MAEPLFAPGEPPHFTTRLLHVEFSRAKRGLMSQGIARLNLRPVFPGRQFVHWQAHANGDDGIARRDECRQVHESGVIQCLPGLAIDNPELNPNDRVVR